MKDKKNSAMLAALGAGAVKLNREPVAIPRFDDDGKQTGEFITVYVRELGAMERKEIAMRAYHDGRTGISDCMAAAVSDDDDNRFTVEEFMALRDEVIKPLTDAFNRINRTESEAGEDAEKK